ncbi:MAG: glycosyltransferase family 2 protein [Cyanobacteria bacterium P01_D01_bin.44]
MTSSQTETVHKSELHHKTVELSIVMPCLNEAQTLGICIQKAAAYLQKYDVSGEIVIADNGSTDGSQAIAQNLGVRVIHVEEKGYGSALMAGISAAQGEYVIMGDADDSYDFSDLTLFLKELRGGYDLVMGNRFKGGIKPGAMPRLNRLGNPILTGIGKLFFPNPCGDFQCGLRGFSKKAIESLNLRTTGMEFASEMVVKATLNKLHMTEVPTTLSPDGRNRPPHMRPLRDGWRNLRFYLLYSPRWLFLYPGLFLMGIGFVGVSLLSFRRWGIFDIHTLLFLATSLIIGSQAIMFSILTKYFAINAKLLPYNPWFEEKIRYFTLERGAISGLFLVLAGVAGSFYAFGIWQANAFGGLDPFRIMRIAIPSITSLIIGFQVIIGSFFLSVLALKRK